MKVYLDNAATTPLSPSVKNYITSLLDSFYNPSSTYEAGKESKRIIEKARDNVAKFINADPDEIIFTSGGSASNTLAIKGYDKANNCTVLYSAIAHKSILKCVEDVCFTQKIYVDGDGKINLFILEDILEHCDPKPFVVIDYANSEIGTIQNVKKIIKLTHSFNGIVYLDCTGSISSIPVDVKELDVDMIGFSGHKIHALKGCGVLYKKKDIELSPLIYGSQEHGLFGGTENVLGIAAIGKAVENYKYENNSFNSRDYVWNYIKDNIQDIYIVGSEKDRLKHNLFMCVKGIDGEQLMTLLDAKGIQVSVGSACNSGNKEPSNTLKEIHLNNEDLNSCIRMTFSGSETIDELNYVCDEFKKCVDTLRKFA